MDNVYSNIKRILKIDENLKKIVKLNSRYFKLKKLKIEIKKGDKLICIKADNVRLEFIAWDIVDTTLKERSIYTINRLTGGLVLLEENQDLYYDINRFVRLNEQRAKKIKCQTKCQTN